MRKVTLWLTRSYILIFSAFLKKIVDVPDIISVVLITRDKTRDYSIVFIHYFDTHSSDTVILSASKRLLAFSVTSKDLRSQLVTTFPFC